MFLDAAVTCICNPYLVASSSSPQRGAWRVRGKFCIEGGLRTCLHMRSRFIRIYVYILDCWRFLYHRPWLEYIAAIVQVVLYKAIVWKEHAKFSRDAHVPGKASRGNHVEIANLEFSCSCARAFGHKCAGTILVWIMHRGIIAQSGVRRHYKHFQVKFP